MKRAARMQNGLALKRIKAALEIQQAATNPQRLRAHENMDCYEHLATALARRGHGPTPAQIQAFVKNFDDDPSEEMRELFLLLKSLHKLPEGPERKAARRKARVQVNQMMESYQRVCIKIAEKLDEMQSPENLAALTAPRDEQSLLMQRQEDSSLRQLWRLTNMLFRVRNGALSLRDVRNEGTTGDVYENKDDA